MSPVALIFLVTCFCYATGQKTCSFPSGGGRGVCTSLYDCRPVLRILQNSHKTENYAAKLENYQQCGGEPETVCCPGPCYTPDGQQGECVSTYECPSVANLLKEPVSEENKQYFKKFICKGPEELSVCCESEMTVSVLEPHVCASEQKISALPPDPRTECCGMESGIKDKIVGGNETAVDEYPWLILIEYLKQEKLTTACGGSLISGRYALTAAHCVVGNILKEVGNPVSIRLGEHDTNNSGPDCTLVPGGSRICNHGITQIPIEHTVPHPDYETRNHSPNDIALIRLKEAAPYNDFIRPICLPTVDVTASPPAYFFLFVAGWGLNDTNTRNPSNLKQHVDLPYQERDECKRSYSGITPGQICAGGVPGKDSCKGDSGGPLMYENIRTYEVIGLVSYGSPNCGQSGNPGVYTKVFEYLPWIKENIVP